MKSLAWLALLVIIVACGSTKKIDRNAIKEVKKVAVVVYTVPEKIEFKEDPRGKKMVFL